MCLDATLIYGHAHRVNDTFLIVIIGLVLGGIGLAALRSTRRPSTEDLRRERASGLLARLEDMPTVQLHDLFVGLANSTTEQQDWLEALLDELRDVPETDGYSPDAE